MKCYILICVLGTVICQDSLYVIRHDAQNGAYYRIELTDGDILSLSRIETCFHQSVARTAWIIDCLRVSESARISVISPLNTENCTLSDVITALHNHSAVVLGDCDGLRCSLWRFDAVTRTETSSIDNTKTKNNNTENNTTTVTHNTHHSSPAAERAVLGSLLALSLLSHLTTGLCLYLRQRRVTHPQEETQTTEYYKHNVKRDHIDSHRNDHYYNHTMKREIRDKNRRNGDYYNHTMKRDKEKQEGVTEYYNRTVKREKIGDKDEAEDYSYVVTEVSPKDAANTELSPNEGQTDTTGAPSKLAPGDSVTQKLSDTEVVEYR